MDIEKLITSFNAGGYHEDIEPFFNDVLTFFKVVKKYNLYLLEEINLSEIPHRELSKEVFDFLIENNLIMPKDYYDIPNEFKNLYLLHGLENNYESTVIFIAKDLLSDVEVRSDGFYLYLGDREELSIFFCSSNRRDTSASDIAKIVLNGDSNDWYYNEYTKPSEVIDVLDESNLTRLKDVIFKEIGDIELSLNKYNTDFFESLSEDQETEGYFRIRAEDLNDLLKDDASINKLCNGELSDLGSELSSLYSSSENSAYEDEVFPLVYDGLDEYFEGHITETPVSQTLGDGTIKIRYNNHIKIRDFIGNVKSFLNENSGAGYNDSLLEYYGSYTELMNHMINDGFYECINFRIPDYPDYRRTEKNINEYFTDYI